MQAAYRHYLGMCEFHNTGDMEDDWIAAVAENEFEAADLRLDINSSRAFAREAPKQAW